MSEEGKNIHIVFADEGPKSMDEIDHDSRDQENIDREKIYDEEISPLIKQVIEKCLEYKMPLFLECEYSKGDFVKTCLRPEEWNPHAVFTTLDVITQCIQSGGVNIDKYLFWVIKQIKEAGGHGSIFMSQLGYKAETGEYEWEQAYHMLQGAKPVVKVICKKQQASEAGEKYIMHSCSCETCLLEDRLYDKIKAGEEEQENGN